MDEEEIVETPDSQEPAGTTEPKDPVEPEEDLQALRAKAALAGDLEAKNKQLFERAKKAEGFELVDGKWVKAAKPAPAPKPKANDDLSGKDIRNYHFPYWIRKRVNKRPHGFVGKYRKYYPGDYGIVSNDSNTGLLLELWDLTRWQKYYGQQGGLPVAFFRAL